MSHDYNICILGGTGFVGRAIARQAAAKGYSVKILSRHPERHRALLTSPGVSIVKANIHDENELRQQFAGSDVVINLVGILNQFRHQKFRKVHVDLPRKVMKACWKAGVTRLLHMSALKADAGTGTSQYLRTKGEAEDLLHVDAGDGLQVIRYRPSVIFGPQDQFFNRFAKLLKLSPIMFPLACARAKFAPVYVGDVAQAFIKGIDDPAVNQERYDLCGPRGYSLQELVQYTADTAGIKTRIIPLGSLLSKLQAAILELVPGKPFTLDNFYSTLVDSTCDQNGLALLGIKPTPVEAVVPGYLGNQQQRARYDSFRRDAVKNKETPFG